MNDSIEKIFYLKGITVVSSAEEQIKLQKSFVNPTIKIKNVGLNVGINVGL